MVSYSMSYRKMHFDLIKFHLSQSESKLNEIVLYLPCFFFFSPYNFCGQSLQNALIDSEMAMSNIRTMFVTNRFIQVRRMVATR